MPQKNIFKLIKSKGWHTDSHRDQRKASFNEYCDAHKGDIRFILVITMRLTKMTKVYFSEHYEAHKDDMKVLLVSTMRLTKRT